MSKKVEVINAVEIGGKVYYSDKEYIAELSQKAKESKKVNSSDMKEEC